MVVVVVVVAEGGFLVGIDGELRLGGFACRLVHLVARSGFRGQGSAFWVEG
jgi:hypothetical protein